MHTFRIRALRPALETGKHVPARNEDGKAALLSLLLRFGALIWFSAFKKVRAAAAQIKSKLSATPLIISLPSG